MKRGYVSRLFSNIAASDNFARGMERVMDHVLPRALVYGTVATGVGMAVPATMYQQGFELGLATMAAADATVHLARAGIRLARRFATQASGRIRMPQPRSSKPRYQPAPTGLSQALS